MNRIGLALMALLVLVGEVYAQKDLVISGGNQVSSLVCANRKVYTWGGNAAGTPTVTGILGTGDNTSAFINVPTAVVGFPPNLNIEQVNSGSGSHFVALDCNGSVWGWGENAHGQVGNGLFGTATTAPAQVLAGVLTGDPIHDDGSGFLSGVNTVFAGNVNSFAILDDGRLVAWGGNHSGTSPNASGQLGDGTTTRQVTPVFVTSGATGDGQTANQPLQGVIEVYAGDQTAVALVDLDGDGVGTVYSWGTGGTGNNLGRNATGTANPNNGTDITSSRAYPVIGQDGLPLSNITQITAGDVSTFALDEDGYVWGWGNDWGGSDGDGYAGNAGGPGNGSAWGGSMPRRVAAGEATGAGSDGIFLLAKQIGAGQANGMAVTLDNKPVAWGAGGCAACLGNGTTGTSDDPVYIINSVTGLVDDNVSLINKGDRWGFYATTDNDFYTWGVNNVGQLGIGSSTNQLEAVPIVPPSGCGFQDPRPDVNLYPRDTAVCTGFGTAILRSGFSVSAALDAQYQVTWFRNGAQVDQGTPSTHETYTISDVGTYRVEIEYLGSNGACNGYPVAFGETEVTYSVAPFTDPGTGTYCGNSVIMASVTGTGSFEWYAANAGGASIATSTDNGNATAINDISGAGLTSPAANTYRVWVEDVGSFYANVVQDADYTASGLDPNGKNGNDSRINFTVHSDMTLNSMNVNFRSYFAGGRGEIEIFTSGGASLGSFQALSTYGATGHIIQNIEIGLLLTAGDYYIEAVEQASYYTNPGNALQTYQHNGQDVITFNSLGQATTLVLYQDWDVTVGTPYLCGRVPVDLTEDCPPCDPPTLVSIQNTPPQTPCEGVDWDINANVTEGLSPTTGYIYSWYKDGVVFIPTASTSHTIASGAPITDDGWYKIRVEDGNAGNPVCYLEDSIEVTFLAAPAITTQPVDDQICEGDNYSFSVVATGAGLSYQWSQGATNVGTDSDTYSGTNAALTDAGSYTVEVTGTCGNETSNPATLTVNEAIVITVDPADVSTCSGSAASFSVTATGTDPKTYQWLYNGSPIATETNAILNLTNVQLSDQGDYSVEVTNSCGTVTSATAELTITSTETPTVSLVVDSSSICENGTVVFVASGNGTGAAPLYEFKDAVSNAVLQAGSASTSYSAASLTSDLSVVVELTSNSTCLDPGFTNPAISNQVDVTVVAEPTTPIIDQASAQICTATFSLTSQPIGTNTGTWSTDLGSISGATSTAATLNLSEGETATVTYTTSSGPECADKSTTISVERLGTMTTPAAGNDQILCEGDAVTMAANSALAAGESGTWTLPAGISLAGGSALTDFDAGLTATGPGTYTMTWTVSNGVCPDESDDVEVQIDEAPTNVSVASANIVTCTGTITLNAATPSPATSVGTWTVTSEPTVGATSILFPNQNDSQADIEDGTTTFNWEVVNGVCPAVDVNLTIEKLGDITTPSISLNGGDFSNSDVTDATVDLCEGLAYTITGASPNLGAGEIGSWSDNGGTNVLITGGTIEAQPLNTVDAAGTQTTLTWTIDNPSVGGCPVESRDVTFNVFAAPTASITSVESADTCSGVDLDINVAAINGTDVGTWTGGTPTGTAPNFTLSNVAVGTINLTWTVDNDGCDAASDVTSIVVSETVTPSVDIAEDPVVLQCVGSDVALNAVPTHGGSNPTYAWLADPGVFGSSTVHTVVSQGTQTIQVTMTSSLKCVTSSTAVHDFTFEAVDGPSPSITIDTVRMCETGQIVATVDPGNAYQWFNNSGAIVGATGTTLTINSSDTYYLTEDNGICAPLASNSLDLVVDQTPFVNAGQDEAYELGTTIFLDGESNATTIAWSPAGLLVDPADLETEYIPLTGGSQEFVLTATTGTCSNTDAVTISIRLPLEFINVFTPNGDNLNEVWTIGNIDTFPEAIVRIYNKWGQVVFERFADYFGSEWDGTNFKNGKPLPVGTYYFIVDPGTDTPETFPVEKGWIELMR